MQFKLTKHAQKRIDERGLPAPTSGMNLKPAGKKTRRAIRELCKKSGYKFDKVYWTYRLETSEGIKVVVYVCRQVYIGVYAVITAFVLQTQINNQCQ